MIQQLNRILRQHDWFYQYTEDSYIYQSGKQSESNLKKAIQISLEEDKDLTDSIINKFLSEKYEKCLPTDFHFYLTPIKDIYYQSKKELTFIKE